VRNLAPDVTWRKVVGTRNRLMHAYPSTDDATIWSIVTQDIPQLHRALRALLDRLPPSA